MKYTLLQWNVLYEEKASNVLDLIGELSPDILCLQELTQDSEQNPHVDIPELIKSRNYAGYYTAAINQPGFMMGNGIFSKFPIIHTSTRATQVSDKSGDYSRETRLYLEVSLSIKGSLLRVGTTHLSYNEQFRQTTRREKENDTFLSYVESGHAPLIFTGDFNAAPETRLITRLREKFVNAGPDFSEKTWTTKPFEHGDFKANLLGWRLDYVFCTPDVKVLSSKIVQTEYSDHLPILVEFEI